jgi:hypothetical protein
VEESRVTLALYSAVVDTGLHFHEPRPPVQGTLASGKLIVAAKLAFDLFITALGPSTSSMSRSASTSSSSAPLSRACSASSSPSAG